MSAGYAVVDVETTGLSPAQHDRIAEIAVVQVDLAGRVVDEWSTLVNPERDLGPQRIHGITAGDARRAPKFADIIGDLTVRLAGRMLVAHNLSFDAGFLSAEYARAGAGLDIQTVPGLCTMRLAHDFLPASNRQLSVCCQAAGVEFTDAHAALPDARACAGLLASFIRAAGRPEPWAPLLDVSQSITWPALRPCGRTVLRGQTESLPTHFLARLVEHLPPVSEPPQADSYLALLDAALLDRHLCATEQDALSERAVALHLRLDEVVALHRTYLLALACVTLADGTVTAVERADLLAVADLLGLGQQAVDEALLVATTGPADLSVQRRQGLALGDLVVFTGQMVQPRETWEQRAVSAGLQVTGGVTKKTRLVVAADPDSMSGKAKKARDYGIPVVTENAFATMLEAMCVPAAAGRTR
ncbi:MAG: exonuclease domain-containing protein [Sciscionella sp.]